MAGADDNFDGAKSRYDLSRFSPEQRMDLAFLIREAGIPFRWSAATLIVLTADAELVDTQVALLARRKVTDTRAGPVDGFWEPGPLCDPLDDRSTRFWDDDDRPGDDMAALARPRLPPRRPADRTDAIRGGGVALTGFVGGFVAAIFVGLALSALDADRLVILVAVQTTAWCGLLWACLVAVRHHADGSLRVLGLQRPSKRDLWTGFKSGLALRGGSFLIAIAAIAAFGSDLGGDPSFSRGIDVDGPTAAVLVAILVVGAPLFEELFFRGLIQAVLTRRWGARTAVFAQAGLFGIVHLWPTMSTGQVVLTLATTSFVGVYLGGLRWRYRRLGPSMVSHAVYNLTAVALVFAID